MAEPVDSLGYIPGHIVSLPILVTLFGNSEPTLFLAFCLARLLAHLSPHEGRGDLRQG